MTLVIVFFGLLLLGLPVAYVLLASAIFFAIDFGRVSVLGSFPATFYAGIDNFELLAIPFFTLLGEIMSFTGLTRLILEAGSRALGRLPRKLAFVVLLANAFLAAILGSANAQAAVMSRVSIPAMEAENYRPSFAAALTAAGSLLGPIIPPSMVFIIYAVIAQVSIKDMFIAGILPGLVLVSLLGVVVILFPVYQKGGHREKQTPAGKGHILPILGALSIPVLITFLILGGVATPTESAAVAVVAALVISAVFFEMPSFAQLGQMLWRTAITTSIVLMLIAAAKVFGFILSYYSVPQTAAELIGTASEGPVSFLLLVIGLLLLIGAVMDGMAAIIILVPILAPIATNTYGISPITFGVIFSMTVVIGLITPPVGSVLYIVSASSGIPVGSLSRAIMPFVVAAILAVLALVLFPQLTLALI